MRFGRVSVVSLSVTLCLALLAGLLLLMGFGLIVLYSAGGASTDAVYRQGVRIAVGIGALLVLSQVPPHILRIWTPWLYVVGIVLLAATPVQAERMFKWVDENGETHYSQTLPPERVQQEHARPRLRQHVLFQVVAVGIKSGVGFTESSLMMCFTAEVSACLRQLIVQAQLPEKIEGDPW